jgi:drug/metabolite transporter (DMT)-like permease
MKKSLGHISAFIAYTIFGFNIIICRDLSTLALVSPMGLFCFRAIGAAALFWLVSLFLPKEKVEKKDFLQIFIASMLGLFLTQVSFLKASTMTTPFDTSILTPLTPIFTMFIAAIALKEPITLKKAGGVALSFIGVIFLVFNTVRAGNGVTETQPMGIVYMVGNCIFFALYLGIFRPLIAKYHVVTFMKWMFLFSAIVAIPFDIKELAHINLIALPTKYLFELGFLILFATFIAYFLIPIGQKVLRPTVISLYGYLQPIIATIMSIATGMDTLTWQKVLAAALVFTGVVLVNKSRAATQNT